jgi:hypothetical protein
MTRSEAGMLARRLGVAAIILVVVAVALVVLAVAGTAVLLWRAIPDRRPPRLDRRTRRLASVVRREVRAGLAERHHEVTS